jgi:archaemetzincin
MKLVAILLLCLALLACGNPGENPSSNVAVAPKKDERAGRLSKSKDSLAKFFQAMIVRDGDWLQSHPENGETFEEYVESAPTLPTAERNKIYIQPMGKFTADQMKVVRLTADYLRAFYNLPVVLSNVEDLKDVPSDMQRIRYPDNLQIKTAYFFDRLPPRLPNDAAAFICFTNFDLYPEDTWNYVFGQASLENRVGVWSLWRLERDGAKKANPARFLDRTLKIAAHETGHMFSMRHCKKYECLMSGSNSLEETDRRPLDTCPECTMKIAWAMPYKPAERYKNLAEFWRKQNRTSEEKLMLDKMRAVGDLR